MANKVIKARAEQIRQWFDAVDPSNIEHRRHLKRAAHMIWEYQTRQEQDTETTHELNGVGFSGRDADFGSRIATWRGDITERMAGGAKKMMRKYAMQLAKIKEGKQ